MFQAKVVEKMKTHFMLNNVFPENRAVYEIMWKKNLKMERPQMTVWRMRIACLIPEVINTC